MYYLCSLRSYYHRLDIPTRYFMLNSITEIIRLTYILDVVDPVYDVETFQIIKISSSNLIQIEQTNDYILDHIGLVSKIKISYLPFEYKYHAMIRKNFDIYEAETEKIFFKIYGKISPDRRKGYIDISSFGVLYRTYSKFGNEPIVLYRYNSIPNILKIRFLSDICIKF